MDETSRRPQYKDKILKSKHKPAAAKTRRRHLAFTEQRFLARILQILEQNAKQANHLAKIVCEIEGTGKGTSSCGRAFWKNG